MKYLIILTLLISCRSSHIPKVTARNKEVPAQVHVIKTNSRKTTVVGQNSLMVDCSNKQGCTITAPQPHVLTVKHVADKRSMGHKALVAGVSSVGVLAVGVLSGIPAVVYLFYIGIAITVVCLLIWTIQKMTK